jgi:hypothetical protein
MGEKLLYDAKDKLATKMEKRIVGVSPFLLLATNRSISDMAFIQSFQSRVADASGSQWR